MILHRVQQNKMFKKNLFGPNDGPSFDLRTAEWFLGSTGRIGKLQQKKKKLNLIYFLTKTER